MNREGDRGADLELALLAATEAGEAVVDPIDGTRSFIAGYREFAISVALVAAPVLHRRLLATVARLGARREDSGGGMRTAEGED